MTQLTESCALPEENHTHHHPQILPVHFPQQEKLFQVRWFYEKHKLYLNTMAFWEPPANLLSQNMCPHSLIQPFNKAFLSYSGHLELDLQIIKILKLH